jgi:hypothetical protein
MSSSAPWSALLSGPIAPVIRITASSGFFARYIDVPLKDVPGHEPVDAGEVGGLVLHLDGRITGNITDRTEIDRCRATNNQADHGVIYLGAIEEHPDLISPSAVSLSFIPTVATTGWPVYTFWLFNDREVASMSAFFSVSSKHHGCSIAMPLPRPCYRDQSTTPIIRNQLALISIP